MRGEGRASAGRIVITRHSERQHVRCAELLPPTLNLARGSVVLGHSESTAAHAAPARVFLRWFRGANHCPPGSLDARN